MCVREDCELRGEFRLLVRKHAHGKKRCVRGAGGNDGHRGYRHATGHPRWGGRALRDDIIERLFG